MLSVTIIGGYLGAGKTTLINHLLRNANGTKIAVLVNEFGALPIDEDLIEAKDDALISIAGGCVCCSYGSDLVQAMLDLSKLDLKPDHLLIESSGVALPGAIAGSVSIMDGFQAEGVIVLADAETIRDQARDTYVGDTVERQLADANIVLLNKTDLVSAAEVAALKAWFTTKAPGASVVTADHAMVPNAIVLQDFDARPTVQDDIPHAPAFQSRVLGFCAEVDAENVAIQLADPALSLVRAKGFVPTSEGMRAIQVVGRRWRVTDAPKGVQAGVVVIAQKENTDLADIERLFAAG